MTLSITGKRLLAAVGIMALAFPVAIAGELPPFGPELGEQADVVRSFHMKTTGSVAREVTGKKGDGKTGLVGRCNPATGWANFGVHQGRPMLDREQAGIAVMTEGKIETGATGKFDTKVYVDFFIVDGAKISNYRFGGPGVLTITTHDATPGKRRMIGTIQASKLEGLERDAEGKTISVEASFDMEFSCGVK